MLRVLVVVVVLAGASAGAWFLVGQEAGPPAVPTSPGTSLGLAVVWEGESAWMCATAEVAKGPSANLTRTQARVRARALLAQACVDAQRALLERVRQGPDGLPELGDPWAALPDAVVGETLEKTREFPAEGLARASLGLPWQAVLQRASLASERLELDDATRTRLAELLVARSDALLADRAALATLWEGQRR